MVAWENKPNLFFCCIRVPLQQVINGQIVVDTSSLTVQAQRSDDVATYTRVEEDARLINTQSYMKKTSG